MLILKRFLPVRQQLNEWLWNDAKLTRGALWSRLPVAALVSCRRNQCSQKAAALTFSTMLAFVPLLAIMFALLKGFGVHNALEPLLIKHLSIGSEEVVKRIVVYINNTNVGRLGSVGLVMLVFTVLGLISTIEKSFNSLWGVNETRTLFRRFTDYFSVVTLGPLFLFAAISMNTSMRNQYVVQWLLSKPVFGDMLLFAFEVLPFVVIGLAFIFLYLFVPNTKVNISSAVLGGLLGGTLWMATQWAYINFQYGVAKYNAIYGTMAALPVFMIWIYVSWMIVLLGLQLCWAYQHRLHLGRKLYQRRSVRWHPLQILEILLLVYNRFQQALPFWTLDELLEQIEVPEDIAREALNFLEQHGVLLLADKDGSRDVLVVPQMAARVLPLRELLRVDADVNHLAPEVADVVMQLQQVRHSYVDALDMQELLTTTRHSKK